VDLAKFGYRSERNVEMLWNLTIIWQHARTSGLNMAISLFSLKYGYFGTFFLQKTFVIIPLPLFFGFIQKEKEKEKENKNKNPWLGTMFFPYIYILIM
jgi:hypothetical protein